MKKTLVAAGIVASTLAIAGCAPAAKTASDNLSTAADNFEINRRVLFVNGITDKVFLQIEGLCSIAQVNGEEQVTCKTGPNEYKKHFMTLSQNVTVITEQLDAAPVDTFHYRIVMRPETLIPGFDVQTSAGNK